MSRDPDSELPMTARPSRRNDSSYYTYAPLLVPIVLFPLTTALALGALFTLPLPHPIPTSPTLKSLSLIISAVKSYLTTSNDILPNLHIVAALSIITVWKHAWSVPGALLINVIAGALWGGLMGTLIMTLLTATGSLASTLLSRCTSRWIEGLMPRAVHVTKNVIDATPSTSKSHFSSDATWVRLVVLRLVGIVPWSGLNIASGIIRIPLLDCFVSTVVGCAPWTAITCHIGDILVNIGPSFPDGEVDGSLVDLIKSPDILLRLLILTLLCLVPIFARSALEKISPLPQEKQSVKQFERVAPEDPSYPRKVRWFSWPFFVRTSFYSRVSRRYGTEKVSMLPITTTAVDRR